VVALMNRKMSALLNVVLALSAVAVEAQTGSLQTGPLGPDITGQWNRTLGNGSVADSRWGSQINVSKTDESLTIRQGAPKPENYRLTGIEYAEVLTVSGCASTTRITKAEASRDTITITNWLITKRDCVHGEDPDDPFISQKGPILPALVIGARVLESKSVFRRDGDSLIVDTTRPTFPPGTTTSSTTYRK